MYMGAHVQAVWCLMREKVCRVLVSMGDNDVDTFVLKW